MSSYLIKKIYRIKGENLFLGKNIETSGYRYNLDID